MRKSTFLTFSSYCPEHRDLFRKLSNYNFTVFDIALEEAYCFLWYFKSLWKFIRIKYEKGCRDFSFNSDNCGGQNRNRILYIACI